MPSHIEINVQIVVKMQELLSGTKGFFPLTSNHGMNMIQTPLFFFQILLTLASFHPQPCQRQLKIILSCSNDSAEAGSKSW